MKTTRRLEPTERRNHILDKAVDVAKFEGYQNVTRELVAVSAGVSPGLVSWYFGTITTLKFHIMREAIYRGIPEILVVGLAIKDPQALEAPDRLKEAAAQVILK